MSSDETEQKRHKELLQTLVDKYGDVDAKALKTDAEILRESYRFIRSEDDDSTELPWVVKMAKKYYSRLFREYALADLSRYREGKIGLRWRSHSEVVSGKGQFTCGEVKCHEQRGLESFEVPFVYKEAGECKRALVKVRVCPRHALQLTRTQKDGGTHEDINDDDIRTKREARKKRTSISPTTGKLQSKQYKTDPTQTGSSSSRDCAL